MNKTQFTEALAAKLEVSKKEGAVILKAFTDCVEDGLTADKEVNIVGFGKWESIFQKPRSGKVPGTDKEYTTPARFIIRFKAGTTLKNKINS